MFLKHQSYHPPDESFSFPVAWHLDDPVAIDSCSFSISLFLAAAVGTLKYVMINIFFQIVKTPTQPQVTKSKTWKWIHSTFNVSSISVILFLEEFFWDHLKYGQL